MSVNNICQEINSSATWISWDYPTNCYRKRLHNSANAIGKVHDVSNSTPLIPPVDYHLMRHIFLQNQTGQEVHKSRKQTWLVHVLHILDKCWSKSTTIVYKSTVMQSECSREMQMLLTRGAGLEKWWNGELEEAVFLEKVISPHLHTITWFRNRGRLGWNGGGNASLTKCLARTAAVETQLYD